MAQVEVPSLNEALCKQYIIIKKLYDELEEERDASATAASEALSMILRLQREKAAERMEASQYKRMAEEKLYHVEESLAILEEVMQQKELEIASLKYRLQVCQRKLSRAGINIPDICEMRIYNKPSSSGSNTPIENTSYGSVRRNTSLPSLFDQLRHEIVLTEEDNTLPGKIYWRKIDDYTSHLSEKCEKSKMPDLHEESVKPAEEVTKKVKLPMQAKHIEAKVEVKHPASYGPPNLDVESTSCSLNSVMSSNRSYDATIGGTGMELNSQFFPSQAKYTVNIQDFDGIISSRQKSESGGSATPSLSIHDVYEVPESHTGICIGEPRKEALEESSLGTEKRNGVTEFMPQEAIDYLLNDDVWFNMQFMNTRKGRKLSKTRKGPPIHPGKLPFKPKKGNSLDYNWTVVDAKFGNSTSQNDIEQLRKCLQHLEDEKVVKEDDTEPDTEKMMLLREIHQQLSTIETRLKSETRKCPSKDDSSLASVMEAVLSFSI